MKLPRIGRGIGATAVALVLAASPAVAGEPDGPQAAGAPPAAPCAVNLETGQAACGADAAQARQLVAAAGDVLVARLYRNTGFDDNPPLSLYAPHSCSESYDDEFGWPDLGNVNGFSWNDMISSVRTYDNCDVKLHDRVGYGGPSSTWIDASSNLANVGAGWNNKASSVSVS
jgi:hypothetical protein